MTKTSVVPQDAPTLQSDAEAATHAADTTSVHGIADTSVLSTTAHDHDADYEAAGGIATHSADSTAVHGITDTAALVIDGDAAAGELAGTYPSPTVAASHSGSTHAATQAAAEATAAGALTGHEADTSVHGIADTSVLATDAEVATAVSDHAAAANPHAVYLTQAEGDAAYEVTGATATHAGAADPHTGYLKEADFDDIDFLVGTATGHTAAEIVVGTSPGGELGGTWASPTVDATHSGSTHAATQTAAEATAAAALTAHEGAANPHATYLTQAEGDALYQPTDGDLTAIAALTTTAFGRGLLELADAAALEAAHSHSGATTTYAPGSFTVATGNYALMSKRLQLTTTQRVTLQGTARLRIT